MNQDRERALLELVRRNPFWVCLLVFAALAADSGFRLFNTIRQRQQLDDARIVQAQNAGRMREVIDQAPRLEAKLQALSLDLLQVARTNPTAAQIVQDFKIEWNPGPAASVSPLTPPSSASTPQPPRASATRATDAPATK